MDLVAYHAPFYTLGDLQEDLADLLNAVRRGNGTFQWFADELRDIAGALDESREFVEGQDDHAHGGTA